MKIKDKIKTIIFKVFGLRFVGLDNKTDKDYINNKCINNLVGKILGIRIVRGYSQCGEDLIIEKLIPNKKDGFFVDIGANHPIRSSNTYLFYKKGWRGISIEPNPSMMWLFKIFRNKDINLNVGIGPVKSEIDLYVFKINTLSTFDKNSAEEYKKMGYKMSKVIKVPVLPLKDILEQHSKGKEIDIMSIDTEGYDMEVLKSNDWKKFRPHFVILETIGGAKADKGIKNMSFDTYMSEISYKSIADTQLNTIYEKSY